MGTLVYSESGRTLLSINEALSRTRRARKLLSLGTTPTGASLYIFAKSHNAASPPLQVRVNDNKFELPAADCGSLRWFRLDLESTHLRPGDNVVDLWTESDGLDAWHLGLEPGHASPKSMLSFDGGAAWQSTHMSIANCLRGEYVVRLRLHDESPEPSLPELVWPDRDDPAWERVRPLFPDSVTCENDPWPAAKALNTWLYGQWQYCNSGPEYAPWDPATILSWGRRQYGNVRPEPIVMCVHYAVVFTSLALAAGIPARHICSSDDLNGCGGHFVSEVWLERWQKWCMLDPTFAMAYVRDGVPLSVGELHDARGELADLAMATGDLTGLKSAEQLAYLDDSRQKIESASYRLWAVWPRNDVLQQPQHTPPSHGAQCYAETDWCWAAANEDLGMFPRRNIDPALLNAPPPDAWR